jgi:tetratricopeptide (TPR) repeat protein
MTEKPENHPHSADALSSEAFPAIAGYEVHGELVGGGSGPAYQARQLGSGRPVVLELSPPGSGASAAELRRFLKEAKAAARLAHPNIVPIYEAGQHQGRPYLSRGLVEGSPLAGHLPRLAEDPRAVAGLLAQIAWAVHYAHERGVVHGHLEPGAVLIDAYGQPHITGFGEASWPGDKPGCTAPEQLGGKRAPGPAADVYGLGVILYECLAGCPPFHRENVPAKSLIPPHELNLEVDRSLGAVCLKCLETAPRKRYCTAAALAEDLEHWLAGVMPPSGREPLLEETGTVVGARHQRQRLFKFVVVGLTATVLFFFGYWFISREPPPLPPPDPQERVAQLNQQIKEGEYREVLTKLTQENLDDGAKRELSEMAVRAWLGSLKLATGNTSYADVKKQVEELEWLRNSEAFQKYVSKRGEVEARYREALPFYVSRRVDELTEEKTFPKALVEVEKLGSGAPERQGMEDRVFSRWTEWAGKLRDEKDFSKAVEIAKAILAQRRTYAPAQQVLGETQRQILAIEKRRDELIGLGSFKEALDYVVKAWPKEAEEHKRLIGTEALKWVVARRKAGEYSKAIAGLTNLRSKLDSDAARQEQKSLDEIAGLDVRISAAAENLYNGKAKDAKDTLTTFRAQLKTGDNRLARIDALLPLADSVAQATENTLDDVLQKIKGARNKPALVGDREGLERLYQRLLGKRIQERITAPPKDEKDARWKQLRDYCNEVRNPDAWVLACRVECLEALRETDGRKWLSACKELLDSTLEPAAATDYRTYAIALAEWWVVGAPDAAKILLPLVKERALPAVLANSAFRKERASRILTEALQPLQRTADFNHPFKNAKGVDCASEAYELLKAARRLVGEGASVDLRRHLLLAAWSKTPRDTDLAKELTDSLVTDKDAVLSPPERCRFWVMHAETRKSDRKVTLDSYLKALDSLRQVLGNKEAGPLVSEYFYREILKPLQNDKGAALLGEKPNDELKPLFVRLCVGIAGLLKEKPVAWSKVTGMDGRPAEVAAKFYGFAFDNASDKRSQAECLVLKGYVKSQLPNVDADELKRLGDQAIELDKEFAGGYALKGDALIRASRFKLEREKQLEDLQVAEKVLDEGLKLRNQLRGDNRGETESLLVKTKAVLLLELANYLSDPTEQEKKLEEAKRLSEESLRLDERSWEGHYIHGLILEDIASLFHKMDQFQPACDAFEKAMQRADVELTQAKPWLGRGRTRFKWADALRAGKASEEDIRKRLDEANRDFASVFDFSPEHEAKAEAYFWRARAYDLLGDLSHAKNCFRKAYDQAKEANHRAWQELALYYWASLSYREASVLYYPRKAGFDRALTEAKERCAELEQLSPAQAATLQIYLVLMDGKASEQLKVFERGLQPGRAQDWPFQVNLLVARAEYYLKQSEPELKKGYEDAIEALKLAQKTPVAPATRAEALAKAGYARYLQAPKNDDKQTKEDYYDEAIQKLGEALRVGPTHFAAWSWKAQLASAMTLRMEEGVKEGAREIKQDASQAAEACRRYLEASQDLPTDERNRADADYYKTTTLPGALRQLKAKAVPKLQSAIDKFPDDPAAWRWHWGIATVLGLGDKEEDRKKAKESLAQALKTKQGASKDDEERLERLARKIQ